MNASSAKNATDFFAAVQEHWYINYGFAAVSALGTAVSVVLALGVICLERPEVEQEPIL
jgi:hypothetical protein